MYDTDELTPDLRDRLTAGTLPAPPQLATITARGRARRRHRRLALIGLSVAGATAVTAVGFEVSGGPAPARPPVADRTGGFPGRGAAPGRIQTASFTLVRYADGTVSLTIDPNELFDPTALERDLADYGIPAQVTPGKICSTDPAPGDVGQVVVYHPGTQPGAGDTITIDPSAMPAGSELSFGIVGLKEGVQAAEFTLIDPNAVSCSTTPLTDGPGQADHGGVLRLPPTN